MERSEYLPLYLAECRDNVQLLSGCVTDLHTGERGPEAVDEIFRHLHSIKSMSAMMGFAGIVRLSHTAEDVVDLLRRRESLPGQEVTDLLHAVVDRLSDAVDGVEESGRDELDPSELVERLHRLVRSGDEARPEPATFAPQAAPERAPVLPRATEARHQPHTVRVDAEQLDDLVARLEHLSALSSRAVTAAAGGAGPAVTGPVLNELARGCEDAEEIVRGMRVISAHVVLGWLPRLVRELSAQLGKRVDLQVVGEQTKLDRVVAQAIGDALVHLVRNALDHGLERPEERRAIGKSEQGILTVSARPEGKFIVVTVTDDGRGVDPSIVAHAAAERGLISSADIDSITEAQAIELLFAPGFSTAAEIDDVSGRGVGMDAVREKLRALGGDVTVVSRAGRGTVSQIRVPLGAAMSGSVSSQRAA